MPLYEYRPVSGQCERCHGRFEVVQRMADEKLTACPECGAACERLISAVALGGRWSLSDSKLKEAGLTKYRKAENGVYERTTGTEGPETIVRK